MTRLGLLHKGAVAGVAGMAAGSSCRSLGSRGTGSSASDAAVPHRWEFDYVTAMARRFGRPTSSARGAGGRCGTTSTASSPAAGPGPPLYLNGPFFRRPTPATVQIPMTPADVYRAFLPGTTTSPADLRQPVHAARGRPADGSDDGASDGKATVPIGARPRSRARTSTRCSVRTCSRGCLPIRPTAGTRTCRLSRSGTPATRCAGRPLLPIHLQQEGVPVREQAAAARSKYATQASRPAPQRPARRSGERVHQQDEGGCSRGQQEGGRCDFASVGSWILAAELTKPVLTVVGLERGHDRSTATGRTTTTSCATRSA